MYRYISEHHVRGSCEPGKIFTVHAVPSIALGCFGHVYIIGIVGFVGFSADSKTVTGGIFFGVVIFLAAIVYLTGKFWYTLKDNKTAQELAGIHTILQLARN